MSDKVTSDFKNLKDRLAHIESIVNKSNGLLDESEIAMTVGKITGVPVAKMVGDEKQKILDMEKIIKERLIGQDNAIENIAEAVRKARAGLKRANRPIGSFLFLGPTGVGKTYLAKLLADGGNLLLLDEPTNDLDVETLRALEEALLNFPGCAVVISHDRWFLDRIATHMLAFEGDSQLTWFEGNYADYEEDRKRRLGDDSAQPKRISYKKFQ